MTLLKLCRVAAAMVGVAGFLTAHAQAQSAATVDPMLYAGLTWRNLGPFRGGRVAAVSGAVGQPGVFYAGYPSAGLWKTTSAGATWYPVFDGIKDVSSVGAVDVSVSDPNVIYLGTGDLITGGAINEGNGVYKSTDAGRTWRHVGLDATKQIPSVLIDVHDPNIVLAAAQGDVHVKSHSRGVFRSADGGATWTQTLFVNDSTGLQKLARANDVPNVIFATTVLHYTPAPAPGAPVPTPAQNLSATATSIYKSTDGGVTWQLLPGTGLPRLRNRTSIAVAMGTNAQRVFLVTIDGLYRSDDGGATWKTMAADDPRVKSGQNGYNCGVYIDPQNPDVVYVLNTSSYKSVDGGNTFTGFKGAPGGDDPQQLWIDPTNGKRMLMGVDQGAIVTLDGGDTWSSWYTQSTEQIYHLSIDNSVPYWVYGSQQDAGSVRTRIRGDLGAITPLDWSPVPGWEWGTDVPDPLDPNTVYASGSGIVKISYPGETWINVSPAADPANKLRTAFSQPIAFAPWNQHMLMAGFQSLWSTVDAGAHWTAMSPDLGIRGDAPPARAGGPPSVGGAIESIGASTAAAGLVWVGTNNGLIKVTRNAGKTWQDASIPDIPNSARAEVLYVEPSHFTPAEAYAVVDLHRIGDYTPYLYRTRDFGKTWTKIVDGLATNQPNGSFARVLRNDTKKAGLLFAGTESSMYVSFDDGDHWQTLMQNLPTTSYRDMMIKNNDLVVATYGRGFWALDDYSMLRQVTPAMANDAAHLFKPGDAIRFRRNVGADTPFPPEVPHALNPPEGVQIDYWLGHAANGPVTLEVLDTAGNVVRHMSSVAEAPVAEAARPPHPNFWLAPPEALPAARGTNRTHWDLRYDSPPAFSHSFEINANPGLTPPSPEGPVALPGSYVLKLTADGHTYSQTVMVHPDPRSPASGAALRSQHALQMKIYQGIVASHAAYDMAVALHADIRGAVPAGSASDADAAALVAGLDSVIGAQGGGRGGFGGGGGGGGRGGRGAPTPTFRALNAAFVSQLNAQDLGDLAPTSATVAGFAASCKDLQAAVAMLDRLRRSGVSALNRTLTARGQAALPVSSSPIVVPKCS